MATVLLVDIAEPAVLAAARQGLQHFATALCLNQTSGGEQARQPACDAEAQAAALPLRPVLGLCNLAKPPQALKPVLQVRYRPGPLVLRDFHAAVGRLLHSPDGSGPTASITGAMAAGALQQLVGLVAQDAACAGSKRRPRVLYLTDRLCYEPDDFGSCLEVCRSKVDVHLAFMAADNDSSSIDALASAWAAAEAVFPHLCVTLVRGASKVSFDALASSLLQCFTYQPQLPVALQLKQPLMGTIRTLPLSCSTEVRPLQQAVCHALLCPCHQAPTAAAAPGASACCAISGALLDRGQCRTDEKTIMVGSHPAGALHLSAPFNIASVSSGGSGDGSAATLSVVARIKADHANPSVLFGVPMLLAAQRPGQAFKVMADGGLLDVSTEQLLEALCSSLRESHQALLATSATDLERGRTGLFRLHYLLQPCTSSAGRPATLCARRVASAEELLAPCLAPPSVSAAAIPAAVAEGVAGQLAHLPLEPLNPLSLSSRCHETVEMLVRESQPPPKPPAPAPLAAPAQAAAGAPPPFPAAAFKSRAHAATQPPADAAAAVMGNTPAPTAGARESGRQRAAANKKTPAAGVGGKGALEFRRSGRR